MQETSMDDSDDSEIEWPVEFSKKNKSDIVKVDSSDSDSEVDLSKKRKYNVLEDEDCDETDDDDKDSESDESDDSDDNNFDEVTLADDVNNEQCAICLMDFTDQKMGAPNSCSHVFCLFCIQEWAKNVNTCPVDRKVFYSIAVKRGKNGVTIEQIKVEDRTEVKDDYEDPTTCEVCGVGDREDRMLLCDGCDRGFHLECLTPPLDNVPVEEWFCPDCFIQPTQHDSEHCLVDNTQQSDTIDYSQHAIEFSDDDETMTVELLSRPIANRSVSMDSGPSTSQQRHARTVATSRPRQGRRRRRQEQSRSRRKKKTKKTKSSSQGATSSSTRAAKPKKKKAMKKRKSRNKKKRRPKVESDAPSTSRYLLPHEMEPTATFSLFGSDYDLEYLPVIEPPVVTEVSSPGPSTATNPDVLGSIFIGLNTLNSRSLSVDNKGRLTNEENKTDSQFAERPKNPKTETKISSTLNKGRNPSSSLRSSSSCSSQSMFGRSAMYGDVNTMSNNLVTEKYKGDKDLRRLTNEKRIKRFDTRLCAAITRPRMDCTSKNENTSPKSDPEKKVIKQEKLTLSSMSSNTVTRSLSETQPSLGLYKIPRKNITSASNSSSKNSAESSRSSSKSKQDTILKKGTGVESAQSRLVPTKFKIPSTPIQRTGILHLLPVKVEKQSVVTGRTRRDVKKRSENSQDLASSLKYASYPALDKTGKDRNSKGLASGLNSASDPALGNARENANSQDLECGSKSLSYPTIGNSREDANLLPREKELLKKSLRFTPSPIVDSSCRGLTSSVPSGERAQFESARPIAVVRPTKVGESRLQEAEAAERRREGIERLQRKQVICEEVKKALKPFYRYNEISKEDYKYIYGRAVEKISKSCLPVVSRDVASFVKNYVKKLKGRQIQHKVED